MTNFFRKKFGSGSRRSEQRQLVAGSWRRGEEVRSQRRQALDHAEPLAGKLGPAVDQLGPEALAAHPLSEFGVVVAPAMEFMTRLTSPFVTLLDASTGLIFRLLRVNRDADNGVTEAAEATPIAFDSFMLAKEDLARFGYEESQYLLATDTAVVVPVGKTVVMNVTAAGGICI